jgi:hypothetical protein
VHQLEVFLLLVFSIGDLAKLVNHPQQDLAKFSYTPKYGSRKF